MVVVVTTDAAERAVQEGRVVSLDGKQSAALSFSSILSLPAVPDTVPGQLAAAVDRARA